MRLLIRPVLIVAAPEIVPSELGPQPLHLPLDQHARVRLLVEDLGEGYQHHSDDEHDPEVPPPSDRLGQEPPDQRTERRSHQRAEGVYAHGEAALVGPEHVGYNAGTERQAPGTANTAEESKDDQGLDVGRQRTANLPAAEEDVRYAQNRSSPVNLAQRGEKQGSDDVPQQVDAHRHGADDLVGVSEVLVQGPDPGSEDGGCKGGDEGDGRDEADDEPLLAVGEVERHVRVGLRVPSYDARGEIRGGDGGEGDAFSFPVFRGLAVSAFAPAPADGA